MAGLKLVLLFVMRWSLMLTGAAVLLWQFGRPVLPPGFPLCELPLRHSSVNSDASVKAGRTMPNAAPFPRFAQTLCSRRRMWTGEDMGRSS